MNNTQKKIIAAEVVVGVLFILFVFFGDMRKIPGFECESFGCIGNAIILLFLAVIVIPLLFGFVGVLAVRESRIRGGVMSFLSALVIMVLIVGGLNIFNKIRINSAVEEAMIQEQMLLEEIEKHQRTK